MVTNASFSAARAICEDGYTVLLSGFDRIEQLLGHVDGIVTAAGMRALQRGHYSALPVTKDGKTLNACLLREKYRSTIRSPV